MPDIGDWFEICCLVKVSLFTTFNVYRAQSHIYSTYIATVHWQPESGRLRHRCRHVALM